MDSCPQGGNDEVSEVQILEYIISTVIKVLQNLIWKLLELMNPNYWVEDTGNWILTSTADDLGPYIF